MDINLKNQIKLSVTQKLQEAKIPGATIAIYSRGEPLLSMGIGYQDIKYKIPMSKDNIFYIYSITKILLATAILSLIEEGKLDLDTSVQKYLPDDVPLDSSITLRRILSHTSGLPDYGGIKAYFDDLKSQPRFPWSTNKFLSIIKSQGLRFIPGKDWAYSNIGYLLLKIIVEKVTSLSLKQYLEELIFKPLNLQKTFVVETLEDTTQLTPGYSSFFSDNEIENITSFYHPGWVSHGVVASNALELGKIIDFLFTSNLLNPLSVEEMLDPIHVFEKQHPLFKSIGYGLGLCLAINSPYGKVAGHNGSGPGYSVAAFHFPDLLENPMTFVALTNRDHHELELGTIIIFKIIRSIECYS